MKREKKYLKLDMRGEKYGKAEKEMREIARYRGMELKTLKKMAQGTDQYRKRINSPTLKGNR